MENQFYRTVIRSAKTNETELIVEQSKDFGKCLNEARQLIGKGISPNQVDILSLTDDENWESIWDDAERGCK